MKIVKHFASKVYQSIMLVFYEEGDRIEKESKAVFLYLKGSWEISLFGVLRDGSAGCG